MSDTRSSGRHRSYTVVVAPDDPLASGHRRRCIERRSTRCVRCDGAERGGKRPAKVCTIFDQAIVDPVRDAPPSASGFPSVDLHASQRFLDAGVDVLFAMALQLP